MSRDDLFALNRKDNKFWNRLRYFIVFWSERSSHNYYWPRRSNNKEFPNIYYVGFRLQTSQKYVHWFYQGYEQEDYVHGGSLFCVSNYPTFSQGSGLFPNIFVLTMDGLANDIKNGVQCVFFMLLILCWWMRLKRYSFLNKVFKLMMFL